MEKRGGIGGCAAQGKRQNALSFCLLLFVVVGAQTRPTATKSARGRQEPLGKKENTTHATRNSRKAPCFKCCCASFLPGGSARARQARNLSAQQTLRGADATHQTPTTVRRDIEGVNVLSKGVESKKRVWGGSSGGGGVQKQGENDHKQGSE